MLVEPHILLIFEYFPLLFHNFEAHNYNQQSDKPCSKNEIRRNINILLIIPCKRQSNVLPV
jgi:hypothetical protein